MREIIIRLTDEGELIPIAELVRCKDCKHLYKDGECPLRTWFTHMEDDWCSYGERSESETEV